MAAETLAARRKLIENGIVPAASISFEKSGATLTFQYAG